jgi:solute carrier family 25 citrate transporter 1
MATAPSEKKKPSAMRSILAGATAGAVEICMQHSLTVRLRETIVLTLLQQSHIPQSVCSPSSLPDREYDADPNIVAKTRSQLNRRLPDGKKLPWPPFGKQWYAGCTTLIIGNSLKAGISAFPGGC